MSTAALLYTDTCHMTNIVEDVIPDLQQRLLYVKSYST